MVKFSQDANGNLDMDPNGSTLTVDQTNDRVGIGTMTPSSLLEVAGVSNFTGTINASAAGNSISVTDTLRIAETGSGLRMTNVGGFDNDGSTNFVVFGTNDLILCANGDAGTAITVDATAQDVTIQNDLRIGASSLYIAGSQVTATASEINLLGGATLTANEFMVADPGGTTFTTTSVLQYDAINQRIGIGTGSPQVKLDMVSSTANETQFRMEQANNDADAPDIRIYKARGTVASKTAVADDDFLFGINCFAYDGSSYSNAASFHIRADGTSGDGYFQLSTTQGGTSSVRLATTDTGAIRISDAFTLPTSDGSASQVLQTDGSGTVSWATVSGGGGTPGGNPGEIQFNSAGSFGGDTNLVWDDTNNRLGVGTSSPASPLHVVIDDLNEALRLESTDATVGTNSAPDIAIISPKNTSNDYLGGVFFKGNNSSGSQITYASNFSRIDSSTAGSEAGSYFITNYHQGANRTMMFMEGHPTSAGRITFNYNAVDIDFGVLKSGGGWGLFIDASTGSVEISDAFTLPTSDGSAGQALTTDGSGNVGWTTVLDSTTSDLYIRDARDDGDLGPNEYPDKRMSLTFTDDITGSPNSWDSIITMKGWSDNYRAWQIWSSSSSGSQSVDEVPLYFRSGEEDVQPGWGTTKQILTFPGTVPVTDGSANQILVTNGAGTLSWSDQGGAPGGINGDVQINNNGVLGPANFIQDVNYQEIGGFAPQVGPAPSALPGAIDPFFPMDPAGWAVFEIDGTVYYLPAYTFSPP